jgi:hypothetical protein
MFRIFYNELFADNWLSITSFMHKKPCIHIGSACIGLTLYPLSHQSTGIHFHPVAAIEPAHHHNG